MNFEFKANNKTGLTVKSNIPTDNYNKYVIDFTSKIVQYIDSNTLLTIAKPLGNLKSWRLLNRELRKACDIYCTENNILSHKDYQSKFFYEGVMIGRTTHGAKATWVENDQPIVKPSKVKSKDIEDTPIKKKSKKKHIPFVWDLTKEWDRKNKPIFDALGIEIVE